MKIKSFVIENYRAIRHVELKLGYSLNPIIGVNESGKTSILKAILSFDKGRDNMNNGEHLDPQNKYETTDTVNCKVTAKIELDKHELEALINAAKVKSDSEDYASLRQLENSDEFYLTRHIQKDESEYEASHKKLTEKANKALTKFLVEHLPFILYFDDFTDRVPDEISFPEDYATTGKLQSRNKGREWQEIIKEIFKRADQPLEQFLKIEKRDRKNDVLSDIEDLLNKEIIKEWKKIKKSGKSNLADDSDNLELNIENPEGNKFIFKVRDKSNQERRRTFNITERSKGFQWFFNYMIKLKFNARYKEKQENSIFLLDEPGSYLHSSAQSELLKELESVSQTNTIIYCTHSQFLLNPQVVKLGSIKITEKSESKIVLHEYGSYKGKKDKGALSPVYQALQLNFAQDFVGKLALTEGITDFMLFDMIKANTTLINQEITLIPGAGAGNSSTLISLAIGFAEKFIMLFDNDGGGHDAAKGYTEQFGKEIKYHFHFYNAHKNKFRLEDFISASDKKKLLGLANCGQLAGISNCCANGFMDWNRCCQW